MGICGLDWVEELRVKYPDSSLVNLKNLNYGRGTLYAAASQAGKITSLENIIRWNGIVRIASEYPNLAESLATEWRLKRFRIYPLWGAVEAYPPESAEVILLPRVSEKELTGCGLTGLDKVMNFHAVLIANKHSSETRDMGEILTSLCSGLESMKESISTDTTESPPRRSINTVWDGLPDNMVKLALPDGHQQVHARRILDSAGVKVTDYPSDNGNHRPESSLSGVLLKVIRPQDMPVQVAAGNFDLAVTGRDWLNDHLYQFPRSPIKELLDLKYGRVRLVAVVSKDLSVDDIDSLRLSFSKTARRIRVASEYVNIADRYARNNHLGLYRIIPTWGATEAFVPEDADLLIENTETGRTITRNNLKIIDTLFESSACLIGRNDEMSTEKRNRIEEITEILREAVEVT
jgi:ATP phosphoribosyltransferase